MVTCHTNVNLLKPHRHQGLGKQNKIKIGKQNKTKIIPHNRILSVVNYKINFTFLQVYWCNERQVSDQSGRPQYLQKISFVFMIQFFFSSSSHPPPPPPDFALSLYSRAMRVISQTTQSRLRTLTLLLENRRGFQVVSESFYCRERLRFIYQV